MKSATDILNLSVLLKTITSVIAISITKTTTLAMLIALAVIAAIIIKFN